MTGRDGHGRFLKGTHWRSPQAFREKDWLLREYVQKERTVDAIAAEFGVTDSAIWYWMHKHGITGRTTKEVRARKHWGSPGPMNGMYGCRGSAHPNWQGGRTPLRQFMYQTDAWKKAARSVRKRDKVCRLCGSGEHTVIHHIEPFASAPLFITDETNLILLCSACHRKMQGRERRWRRKLGAIMERG